jgi:hypothetical protein
VAGEHPIGDRLRAAEQRAATRQAADGPGAVAHVDEPEVAVGHGGLLGGGSGGSLTWRREGGLEGWRLDEAEGQQPGRLAVFAGAVGFHKAAVGGLTAAVLLDLALELLQ